MNFAIAWFVGSLKSFICQGVVWSWYRCRTLNLFLNHWMLICEFCISYINSCITLPDSIYFFSFFKLCESYTFYLKLLQRCHNFYTIVCQVFAWLFFWSGYWRWISLNHFLFSYVAQVVDIQGKFLMHFVNKSPCTFFYGYLSSSFIKSQCVSLKCFLLYYLCTYAEFFFLMIVL